VDRQCGSSPQASEFAVADAVESMTWVPLGSSTEVSGTPSGQTVFDRCHVEMFNQGP
jgi:hypothetical protein